MSQKRKPWARQQLQLPPELAAQFRDLVSKRPDGGVKIVGAAAIAAYLALPEATRLHIERLVMDSEWVGVEVNVSKIEEAMASKHGQDEPSHFVSRILSPEVSLPPDRRPSSPKRKQA